VAWYRVSFDVPQEKVDSPRIILRIGAIDEDGWVWLNGEKIGEVIFNIETDPDSWKKPLDLDVTGKLKAGTNVVAVRVRDQSGAGGLWKPCYLIYGQDEPNLLQDGSFENGGEGWSLTVKGAVTNQIVDTGGYESDHCVEISLPDDDPDALASMTTTVPGEGGTRYALNFRYRTRDLGVNPKVANSPAIRVIFHDAQGKSVTDTRGYFWTSIKPPANAEQWQEANIFFKAVEGTARLHLTIFFHRPGTMWIDDVRLRELGGGED